MKKESKGVRLQPINWDKECKLDMITGKGFRITEEAIKGTAKMSNGIQSEKFGTDFDSDEGFEERYKCPRGCTKGKVYEGSTCPVCGGVVEFKDADFDITGWIILDNYMIIHPIFYNMLESVIGAKVFKDIVTFDKTIDKNGILIPKESSSTPFYGIGIEEFQERFDEILEYYAAKKKNKVDVIDEIMSHRDKVFAHSIPVYSAILRPMSFRGESLFYGAIDKLYNRIVTSVKTLNNSDVYEKICKRREKKKKPHMGKGHYLSKIQDDLMALWKQIFELIDGKEGDIQGNVLGGMLSFTSRDVIIPDPTLKADEIRINYYAFLELYKYELIGLIMRVNNVSATDAMHQVSMAAIEFNEKVYEMMNYLLKIEPRYVIINRNPTINYGSMLCVKIKSVTHTSPENYTMSMPEQVLAVMNADFDGDTLNVISLKTKKLAKAFNKIFNPRFNLFISRNDGMFNNDTNLIKDQLIALYQFNNI